MRAGYLYLTPCPEISQAICLGEALVPPTGGDGLGMVVRFADVDAAAMHFHTELRGRLLDPGLRAYRTSMVEAAAALDAIELRHQCTYLSPALAGSQELPNAVARLHRRHGLVRWIFNLVGVLALLLLLFMGLLPL